MLQRVAHAASIVVIFVAAVVLFGWAAHIPRLTDVFPGLVSMKVNTAISLFFSGAALLILSWNWKSGDCPAPWRLLAALVAAGVFGIALLSGCESIFNVDFHIDQLFFADPITHNPGHPPGRMSPITSANLVYLGAALLFLAGRSAPQFVQLLACSSGFISLVVLTGTYYGLAEMVGNFHSTAVAVHTNFCLLLLFAGILCATGEHGIMRLLTDSGTAGKVIRRLLPTAILVPLLVSSVTATLEQLGFLDFKLGVSIFSITTIVAFAALVWHSGIFLQRSERETRRTEARLRETAHRYTFLADAMPEIVWTAKPDGSVDYFNQRWIQYTGLTLEESTRWGWKLALHADDAQRCIDLWTTSVRDGTDYEIEYRLKGKDGAYRWFVGRGYPLRDEHGTIVQWVGNCSNIDEQKRDRDDLACRVLERTAEVTRARERLQAVLDSATQAAIIAVDVKGTITLFNRGAENIYGYTADEVVGRHNPSIFHVEWELAARMREMSEKYARPIHGFDALVEDVRHGLPEEREWTMVRKDGSRFPARLIMTAMRDGTDEITGFLGIVTDISAQKKANQQLHDQAVLLDLAHESIFIRDVNDLATYWNQGAERLYGWTREEAEGRVTHELLQTQFPQALAQIRAEMHDRGSWEGELTHTRRDGSVLTVASSWTLQRDEVGEPISVIEINHDITARKLAEEEIRQSRERLNTILNSSFDGIIVYESIRDESGKLKDFRFSLLNPAAEKLTGVPASTLIGQSMVEKFPGTVAGGLLEKFTRIVEEGVPLDFEFLSTRTQPPRWYRVAGVKLGDGLVISYADITARKAYEKELQDAKVHAEMADRAKSNFLANMSHEIRTPMNGVIGLSSLLLETPLDSEQHNLAHSIRASAESLLGVINDILDFSKIEAGKLTIEEIDFDLRKVIEDALEVTASLALKKGLELTGGIEPGTPTRLRGDPTRVQQVLTNLIGNALKFTSSGEVSVRVHAQAQTENNVLIRLEVHDTGFGMAPEVQSRLFQPFVQGDTSTSRQFGGTGLGLAICKRLAEAMNGSIGVTSQPGEGSTFWVTIEFSRQGGAATEAAAPDAFANSRVLVVDDNATSRDFLRRHLDAWRLRNEGAASADEALTLLRRAASESQPYPLALVDLTMPGMDGLALAQRIYNDSALQSTRVVLLTPIGKPVPSGEVAPPNVTGGCTKPVRQSALFDCLMQSLAAPALPPGDRPEARRIRSTTSLPARKERILLAEDNAVNRQVALGNLRKLGYSADVAENGLEVLNALESQPYDIILMDCQMPELDGYEATRQIRQRERGTHRTRIIAMTANAMVGDREKCLACGMDDYVSKPLHRSDLRAALERQMPRSAPPLAVNVLERIVEDEPEEISRLAELFISTAPESIEKMRNASAERNAPQLAMAAHTLKGSCGSLGATTLREVCAQLEKNARDGQLEGADDLIASATEELHRFSQALDAYVQSKAAT